MSSRPDLSCSMARLGYFITVPYQLGCIILHTVFCYLHSHPNKTLLFQKSPTDANRLMRVNWSENKSEEFIFENTLELFQDTGHGLQKVTRSSYGMYMHPFMRAACSWKVHRILTPMNSSDTEIRIL